MLGRIPLLSIFIPMLTIQKTAVKNRTNSPPLHFRLYVQVLRSPYKQNGEGEQGGEAEALSVQAFKFF